MNYLVHTYFAGSNEFSIVGAIIPDFKNIVNQIQNNDLGLLKSIKLHNRVDEFTDKHKLIKDARSLVSENIISKVIIDILFDHYFALNWNSYSSVSLNNHCNLVYTCILKHYNLFKISEVVRLDKMREENWLGSYHELNGVKKALIRIKERSKRFTPDLDLIMNNIVNNYNEIECIYSEFIGSLIKYVNCQKELLEMESC